VRVFFALWPDDETRARIANATAAIALTRGARWVPRENYHLTLAFIGEIGDSRLALLEQIGRSQRAVACTIRFDALDHWPESRVLVALAREAPGALLELWARLHADLASLHLVQPARFRAHVTLARKVVQASVQQAMSPIDWNVRSLSLVRSETGGAASVYTVVNTWPLLDKMTTR
jgi:RNA 2',3'-cyclic 3'-phosphodiesterase